jgi:hypothetical protein
LGIGIDFIGKLVFEVQTGSGMPHWFLASLLHVMLGTPSSFVPQSQMVKGPLIGAVAPASSELFISTKMECA